MNPTEPLLAAALADDLANNRAAEGDRPTADNTLLRGSDAYSCARKIAFAALKIPRVVPFTTDTLMAFDAGKHHHARLQGLLVSKFGAELEVPCSYKEVGIEVSGHADGVYTWGTSKRVAEIKSMKSYPFLKAIFLADVDEVQDGRVAEWILPRRCRPGGRARVWVLRRLGRGRTAGLSWEELVVDVVGEELQRLNRIVDEVGDVCAVSAAGGSLTTPTPGMCRQGASPQIGADTSATPTSTAAPSKDEPWNCRYCPWQPLCARLPASKLSIGLIDHPSMTGDEEPF